MFTITAMLDEQKLVAEKTVAQAITRVGPELNRIINEITAQHGWKRAKGVRYLLTLGAIADELKEVNVNSDNTPDHPTP